MRSPSCRRLIEAAGPACVAAKPQLACFERLGAPGWRALGEVVAAAREAGLLVIADGKRGDVPVSAAAYGQALFGSVATPWGEVGGLGADAATVNPLLGGDALEPLIAAAAEAGAGLFALVRTSNPGAADVLDLPGPDGPLYEHLARLVADRAPRLAGHSALSGMGAVVGATEPRHLARLRELMPNSIFLVPGVGAQGGSAAELADGLLGRSGLGAGCRLAVDRRRPRPGGRRRAAPRPGLGRGAKRRPLSLAMRSRASLSAYDPRNHGSQRAGEAQADELDGARDGAARARGRDRGDRAGRHRLPELQRRRREQGARQDYVGHGLQAGRRSGGQGRLLRGSGRGRPGSERDRGEDLRPGRPAGRG